jgi:hypothetical protein
MWGCKICNYETNFLWDYKKHLKTNAHIILEEKNEEKKRKRRENRLKKEIIVCEKLEIIDKKLDKLDKLDQIEKQQDKIEKNQIETSKNVKKITDYIEFLNKYCSDAEPLTLLTSEEVDEILKLHKYKNEDFEEMIIYSIKNKNLHVKLGDLILEKYLNPKDLTKQNIWTSDISRLIYLILQTIGEQKNWVRDKKGELFTELITNPIINRITKIMTKYSKHKLDNYDDSYEKNDENAEMLYNLQAIKNLKLPNYCDEIKKDILKHMASKFSISIKKDEMINKLNFLK